MTTAAARIMGLAAALLAVAAGAASAAEHIVKMRNTNGKGKFMIFEPEVVKAAPGDTVKFVAVDKGHNAETIPEIWPEGAPEIKGEINEEVVLTLEKPGVYGIKCLPHYPMGMMALIVAGDAVNKAQLDGFKPSGGAAKRFQELLSQLPQ